MFFICGQRDTPRFFVHRQNAPVHFNKGGYGDDFLNRALSYELAFACFVRQNDAHAAAREVERDFVDAVVGFEYAFESVLHGPVDNGDINQVFQPGLEIAVEVSVAQYAVVVLAVEIHVLFKHNFIFGERSGFVGAEHIHFAEGLNCTERTYDDLVFGHGNRALCKR
ncbi:hypothetical protein SDC9_141975 [bioreactor metagenome]|uniref:Uncharacterized protein n=1 Tax=bioreactor metagenome TaxID=1076179 RepID=A0A645DZL4_9ZZZZ